MVTKANEKHNKAMQLKYMILSTNCCRINAVTFSACICVLW